MRGALRMRAWILYSALILNLSINPAAAQQPSATEGEAHILSALTSGADPGVLAAGVDVGPALRKQLGGETDSRKIYDALVERTSGKPLRVNLLAPGEVVRYASLPGVQVGEPLIRLEAGEVVLLFQYASKQKNVTFVEQLSKPEAPKPPPIVEVPLPTTPPPPEPPPAPVATPAPTPPVPAAPAPAATPTPPAVVIEKPRPPAVAVQKPAAPVRAEKPRPRGECVIKPVMSEQDLWNCSGPVRPVAVERPALPVEAPKPAAARTETPAPRGECVIKPVMSEEDLRNCAVARPVALERPAPPVAVEKPQPPAPAAPQPKRECVIKPVMSEEDLRACGVRR